MPVEINMFADTSAAFVCFTMSHSFSTQHITKFRGFTNTKVPGLWDPVMFLSACVAFHNVVNYKLN